MLAAIPLKSLIDWLKFVVTHLYSIRTRRQRSWSALMAMVTPTFRHKS